MITLILAIVGGVLFAALIAREFRRADWLVGTLLTIAGFCVGFCSVGLILALGAALWA